MEHRRSLRIPVDWSLTLRRGDRVARASAVQFSEYGMLIGPPEVAEVGQRYSVSFSLPGDKKVFEVRAYAVYTSAKGIGVRFEFVPPEVTAVFRRYVKLAEPTPPAM